MFIYLSELCHFRYGDVPWRHHAKAEPAALSPFLRARIAGHIFLYLVETVSPSIFGAIKTKNPQKNPPFFSTEFSLSQFTS